MAGYDRGANSGITGLISLSGTDPFTGKCYGFARAMEGQTQDFAGRGDDIWGDPRLVGIGGNLLVRFMVQPGLGFPMPANFTGATGSIVLQLHKKEDNTIVKETIAVQVISHKIRRDDGEPKGEPLAPATDNWHGTLVCRITDMPAEAGFPGTQNTGTAPTYSDKELYAGTSKTLDPGHLQDGAVREYLIWPCADNDAAEMTKLSGYVADAVGNNDPTAQGLKVRPSSVTRVNYAAIKVQIVWARTTTDEDVINENTVIVVDPEKLTTHGTVAAINNSAPTLHTVAGQTIVRVNTSTKELNDSNILYVSEEAQRSSKDAVEMEESQEKVDEKGIESVGQSTEVYPAGNAPPIDAAPVDPSLKAVAYTVQEINLDESKKVTYFDVNDSEEKWLYARLRSTFDPFTLKDIVIKGAIFDRDDDPPDTEDSDTTGLVLRDESRFEITSPDTSNLAGVIRTYAQTTSADDEIFPRTRTETDPQNIDTLKITGAIFGAGSPPVDPAAPTGLKLSLKTDISLTNVDASGRVLRLYRWEKQDSLDKIKLPKQKTTVDANNIEGEAVRTKEWLTTDSAPSAPDDAPSTNVKLVDYTDLVIYPVIGGTAGLNLRVFLYGPKDSKDELILPNYETTTDASALESTAIRAYLDGDSVPSTPSGTVLRDTKVRPVTLSLGTNRTLTVLVFGTRTHEEDVTFEKSRAIAEAGNLDRTPEVCVVDTTAAPGDGSAQNPDSTNLSLYWAVTQQSTHAGKYVHVYKFAPLTPTEEMTAQFERDDIDVSLLEDESTRVLYGTTSTPSADPGVSGKVLYRTTVKRVGKVKYRFVYEYRYRTSAAELVAKKTRTKVDVSAIESDAMTAAVWLVSGGAPSTPTLSGYILRTSEDQEIGNPLYRVRVYEWGLSTPQQDREQRASRAISSPLFSYKSEVSTIVTSASSDATLAATLLAANQSNGAFIEAETTHAGLPPGKLLQTLRFDAEDKAIRDGSNHAFRDAVRGVPYSSFVAGDYLPGAITIPDTNAYIYIFYNGGNLQARPQYIWRALGRFIYRRVYVTNTFTDYQYLSLRGTSNNNTFLGYSTGEVMYAGPVATYAFVVSGARRLVVDYEFQTDNWKFFNDGFLPEGKTAVNGGSVSVSGLYLSSQFEAGNFCGFPAASDFSGFL